jgi:hypothetical protein
VHRAGQKLANTGPFAARFCAPSISRARFNIDLARMSRAERELASERIERAKDAAGVMPPPEGRQLDAEARQRLLAYLRQDERSAADDALLAHAAESGMNGGGRL